MKINDKLDLKFNDHMAFYTACKITKQMVEWIMKIFPDIKDMMKNAIIYWIQN